MDFSHLHTGNIVNLPTFPTLDSNGSHVNLAANFDGTGISMKTPKNSTLAAPNISIMHCSSNLDLEGMNTQYNTFNAATSMAKLPV